MTAQIGDIYTYENQDFSIVSMSAPINFKPQILGLTPMSRITACWRGYWCEYEITKCGIILNKLYINTDDSIYPDINGVKAKKADKHIIGRGHNVYNNLNINIDFEGKLLLGKRVIGEYIINIGHPNAWAYKELKEFVFKNGVLTKINDYSNIAKDIRQDGKIFSKEDDDELSKYFIFEKIARQKLPVDYDIHKAEWSVY